MVVFDYVIYKCSNHALQRLKERFSEISSFSMESHLISMVKSGNLILDTGTHRYIRNGILFFPCVKSDENLFVIKSVLTWDMVEHRFQRAVDLYNTIK